MYLLSLSLSLSLCSRQLAEEVMKGGPSDNEEEVEEGGAPAAVQGFEGMEALAKAIELGTVHVHVRLSRPHIQCTAYNASIIIVISCSAGSSAGDTL